MNCRLHAFIRGKGDFGKHPRTPPTKSIILHPRPDKDNDVKYDLSAFGIPIIISLYGNVEIRMIDALPARNSESSPCLTLRSRSSKPMMLLLGEGSQSFQRTIGCSRCVCPGVPEFCPGARSSEAQRDARGQTKPEKASNCSQLYHP